jgi:hypothetical protein
MREKLTDATQLLRILTDASNYAGGKVEDGETNEGQFPTNFIIHCL